jgi:hypothetical protein
MMRKSTLAMMALGLTLAIVELPPGAIFGNLSLIKEAHAIVGRPATPVSAAGVARRTTRRTIVATTTYVAALPPACTVVVVEGASLHHCGSTYYQSSGTQYVVVNVN